jgi:hypothetical protein
MKDSELRDLFTNLDRKIAEATERIVGKPINFKTAIPPKPHFWTMRPWIPAVLGMSLGALIFFAGMVAGSALLK